MNLTSSGVHIFKQPAARLLLLLIPFALSGCSALLFYPMKPLVSSPADWGLDYEDVLISGSEVTDQERSPDLHGWWIPAVGEANATVYFLHGNAENISTHIRSVVWLPAEGINVFLLDYRGYGRSAGQPSVAGAIDDVARGYRWLREKRPGAPIIVLGQSLGGGLAGFAMAQAEHKPNALVLDAAVASYPRIAGEVARRSWLTWPFAALASWLMPSGYDLVDVIARLEGVPLLFFRSDEDTVVPPGHTDSLFAAAAEPKTLIVTEGPHIASFGAAANRERLLEFIRGIVAL